MNEKKNTKVSLTGLLLVLAIIIIGIMAYIIFDLSRDKASEEKTVENLNSEINNLKSTVMSLQNNENSASKDLDKDNQDISKDVDNKTATDNSNIKYQISGRYNLTDAQGDEPSYTFSANDEVTYGALWMCSGTYSINGNKIEINFNNAVDPDGNKVNSPKEFGVPEYVELTILDNNTLKDISDGNIYTK